MNAFQIFDIANDRLLIYIEYGQQIRSEVRDVKPAVDRVKRLVVKARRSAAERNIRQGSQWKFFRRHSFYGWINNLRLRISFVVGPVAWNKQARRKPKWKGPSSGHNQDRIIEAAECLSLLACCHLYLKHSCVKYNRGRSERKVTG